MDNKNTKSDGKLPSNKNSETLGGKKIRPLTKDAAVFLSKMDKKKATSGDIASALEQWLNSE